MKRGTKPMKRGGFLKRAVPRRDPTPPEWKRRHGRCPACLSVGWVDAHHVVPARYLRRRGLHAHLWDERNKLWLGADCCHAPHETRVRPLPRPFVPAETEEFAQELGLTHILDRLYGTRTNEGR
jgi:hypothetical protein